MRSRIWDEYLTDQDRAHVALTGERPPEAGERPVLLLVDLYRWVFGDQPEPLLEAVRTWPGSCGLAGWEALPSIQLLLAAARKAGLPVVHITGMEGLPGWSRGRSHSYQLEGSPEALARRARRFDIIDEVAPAAGDAVIRKSAPSAFWGTPLAGHLIGLGADTVIVAGESTSGCVRATVVDGKSYRLKMVVVEDCVFDRHQAAHAVNLFDMQQKYADVIGVDAAIEYIDRRAGWYRASEGRDRPALPESQGAMDPAEQGVA